MRYTGPVCRQCRREGTKLFLKGTKCFTEKCPVERRPYAPGQHGQATARRRKASETDRDLARITENCSSIRVRMDICHSSRVKGAVARLRPDRV